MSNEKARIEITLDSLSALFDFLDSIESPETAEEGLLSEKESVENSQRCETSVPAGTSGETVVYPVAQEGMPQFNNSLSNNNPEQPISLLFTPPSSPPVDEPGVAGQGILPGNTHMTLSPILPCSMMPAPRVMSPEGMGLVEPSSLAQLFPDGQPASSDPVQLMNPESNGNALLIGPSSFDEFLPENSHENGSALPMANDSAKTGIVSGSIVEVIDVDDDSDVEVIGGVRMPPPLIPIDNELQAHLVPELPITTIDLFADSRATVTNHVDPRKSASFANYEFAKLWVNLTSNCPNPVVQPEPEQGDDDAYPAPHPKRARQPKEEDKS